MNITDEKYKLSFYCISLDSSNKNINPQNDQTSEPKTQHRENIYDPIDSKRNKSFVY